MKSWEKLLQQLDKCSLQNRKKMQYSSTLYVYMKHCYTEKRVDLFSVTSAGKNSTSCLRKELQVDTKKNVFRV